MGFFKPDLYRAFVIGFAVGVAAILVVAGAYSLGGLSHTVIPAAQAAPQLPDQTR